MGNELYVTASDLMASVCVYVGGVLITYALWGACEGILVSHSRFRFVGLTLDDVGHRVLGAQAVHDLLR